jgi:hypothetical protein
LKWQDRQVKFLHGIGRLKGYASVWINFVELYLEFWNHAPKI